MIETCNLCDKEYEYETASGMSRRFCRYCFDKIKSSCRRVAVKDIMGGECKYCGSTGCYSKLSLHHSGSKNFEFSRKLARVSYKRISKEMKGSELLCENCHTKHHCEGSRGYCPEHDWESDCCTEDDTCGDSCYVMFLRHRRRNKMINELGGECEECGYSGCTSAFSFHHEDPDNKEFRLDVTAFSRLMESIRNEVGKCRLLCHNCHQRLHCDCEVKCSGRFSEYTEKAKTGIEKHL